MKNNPIKIAFSVVGALFAGGFATIWIGGWSAGTLFFDYMIFGGAWKQYQSQHWTPTQGVMRKSEVDVSSDSDGTSYSLDIEYVFSAHGRKTTGTRDSYVSGFASKDGKYKRSAELRPGRVVTVYYNPENPSEAVLRNGMTTADAADLAFMGIFITPFNVVMLGSWYFAWNFLTTRWKKDPPHGVRVMEHGTGLIIRLPHMSALAWAGIAAGGISFASVFVLMIFLMALNMPMASFAGCAAIVAGSLIAYSRRAKQIDEGRFDLVLDGLRNTLSVPPCDEKREPVQLKIQELAGVTLEKEETTDSDGDKTTSYWPTLLYGDNQRARVISQRTEDNARHFAVWLARKLKTEFRESAL